MCEHCGCRGVEPLAELMDEHLVLLEISGDVRRAVEGGDTAAVGTHLDRLGELLVPHARVEEVGVFAALRETGDFDEHIDDLESEHAGFDATLAGINLAQPGWQEQVEKLLVDLSAHIDKENLGTFPVAVVSLGASGWNTVTRAHEARAGTRLSA